MEGLKIIIADDEALIRLDLREMLTEAGHTVLGEASDGEEAVELARRLKPDLVIMDVKMPKMDGITAAGIITGQHIASVLLLTAYSQQDVVERANSSGVMAYLVKPVREEQLFATMQVAIARFKEYQKMDSELAGLRESLETRKLLDRAKGILMAAHGFTEDEAYSKMRQYSMNRRITLKELAEAVIASAEKKK